MANCLLPAGQAWYGRELHASIHVHFPSYCSKHLWCEQPVKEIQLTSICYVQICVYSSSYVDFLQWIDCRSAGFADSTCFRSRYLRPNHHCSHLLQSNVWTLLTSLTLSLLQLLEAQYLQHESHRIVRCCLNRQIDLSRKPGMRFFDSTLKNSLTFASNTKAMQMAWEEVAEVSYCYCSRDSREIVRKFSCIGAAKFTDRDGMFWDVLPAAPRRRFLDVTLTDMEYQLLNYLLKFLPNPPVMDYSMSRVPDQTGLSLLYIEGSRPEWCISSVIYSRDPPFWLGTLDIILVRYTVLVGNPRYPSLCKSIWLSITVTE